MWIAAATVYGLTLSAVPALTHDSLTYLRAIEEGGEGLFHPHHLAYNALARVWLDLADATGLGGDPLLSVALLNALLGACAVTLVWFILRARAELPRPLAVAGTAQLIGAATALGIANLFGTVLPATTAANDVYAVRYGALARVVEHGDVVVVDHPHLGVGYARRLTAAEPVPVSDYSFTVGMSRTAAPAANRWWPGSSERSTTGTAPPSTPGSCELRAAGMPGGRAPLSGNASATAGN